MSEFNSLEVQNFDLDKTLKSGQVFVWDKLGEFWYGKTSRGLIVLAQVSPNEILWETYPRINHEDFLKDYLRINFDYSSFVNKRKSDIYFSRSYIQFSGLRLLKQNFFETTISFIISTNKNITSIKSCIRKLSRLLGERVVVDGNEYFLFPSTEKIAAASVADLRTCSLGYRAEYVKEAAIDLCNTNKWEEITNSDEDNIRSNLIKLKGVGDKVADCILCYSLCFDNVTPLDVWGQRVLCTYYGVNPKLSYKKKREWVQQNFNGYAAWIGQYLFEYIRQKEKER